MIEQKKIIFSGLDYVGKTSIINSIQSKYSGLDSKPTLGINRTLMQYTKLLGFSISSWDLGGQSKFRRDYMKNKYRVFSDTKFFFYVVDSQDQDRLGDMLKYLDDILKTFVALKENPKIAILFHKADPDIKKDPEMVEYFENLQMQINFITKDHGFKPPQYFLTTIYDKSTLFFAFSRIVIDGSPKSVLIEERLKQYSKDTFSSAVILFSNEALLFGAHYKKKEYLQVAQAISPHFISVTRRLNDYNIKVDTLSMDINYFDDRSANLDFDIEMEDGTKATIFLTTFYIKDDLGEINPYHILTLTRNKTTVSLSKKHLPVLSQQLENLLVEITKI